MTLQFWSFWYPIPHLSIPKFFSGRCQYIQMMTYEQENVQMQQKLPSTEKRSVSSSHQLRQLPKNSTAEL